MHRTALILPNCQEETSPALQGQPSTFLNVALAHELRALENYSLKYPSILFSHNVNTNTNYLSSHKFLKRCTVLEKEDQIGTSLFI